MSQMPFVDFYARLVDGDHGIETGPGFRPRGFYSEATPGNVRLMVVLQNPGQPLDTEAARRGDATGARLAQIVWDMTGAVLKGEHRSRTLSVLGQDLAYLLGRPFPECLDTVVMSNLVKCTTEKNVTPEDEAVRIGAGWLREEIALWRPDKVVAFGDVPALGMLAHGIQVDAMLPHPASRKRYEYRRHRIDAIRPHLGLG